MKPTISLQPLEIAEFLAVEYPENIIIEGGILDVGGLMLVVGPTSVGKSYLLLQLAMHLVTGTPVVGTWAVRRQFSVYLVQAEIGRKRFQSRAAKLWANFPPGDREKLWMESTYELKLDTAEGLSAVERVVEANGIEVLIIDPLRPFHGRNENDSQEMQILFDSFLRLQLKHDVAIVYGHHDRKPSADGWGRSIYETRGNTLITDRPDTVLRLKPAKQTETVEAIWEKLRNSDRLPPPARWTGDRQTGLFVPIGATAAGADPEAVAVRLLADGGLPLSQLTADLARELTVSRKTAYAIADELVQSGVAIKTDGGGRNQKLISLAEAQA